MARTSEPEPGGHGPGLFDAPAAEPAPLSVGQLARILKSRLAELGRVRVEGELSRLNWASSGHLYFTLKDESAALSCAVWKSARARALGVEPTEGARVVVTARIDFYEPRGSLTLIVEKLEPLGLGALLVELEKLKAQLRARGWFDRKRPLPALPRMVGVVTSRDGAAWQDFQQTLRKRWPDYPLRLCHTQVQGPGAAASIARAIERLAASGVDVIALVRGGGSLEDLWAFNERAVAEAIWNSPVPIVSGVGHETDVTLADLVADLRAHTPTDAAQSVIPSRAEYDERLERAFAYLGEAIHARLLRARHAVELAAGRRLWLSLRTRVERERGALARLAARFAARDPRARIAPLEQRLLHNGQRIRTAGARALDARTHRIALAARGLDATSPLAVLGRGYSVTLASGPGGAVAVRDAASVAAGAELVTLFARGRVHSLATRSEPERAADAAARSAGA
jgi:exodeoxyribonuclease VII large subunit